MNIFLLLLSFALRLSPMFSKSVYTCSSCSVFHLVASCYNLLEIYFHWHFSLCLHNLFKLDVRLVLSRIQDRTIPVVVTSCLMVSIPCPCPSSRRVMIILSESCHFHLHKWWFKNNKSLVSPCYKNSKLTLNFRQWNKMSHFSERHLDMSQHMKWCTM